MSSPPARSRELAVVAQDAVAGNDDDDGVAVVGHADGAERFVVADLHGDMSVGAGFAVGDGLQRLQTDCWKGVPAGASGSEKSRRVPAKYSRSCVAAFSSRGVAAVSGTAAEPSGTAVPKRICVTASPVAVIVTGPTGVSSCNVYVINSSECSRSSFVLCVPLRRATSNGSGRGTPSCRTVCRRG